MRPRQAVEVENDLLAVLDLRRGHLDDLRACQLNGRVEEKRRDGKSEWRATRLDGRRRAPVRKVDVKLVLDGFYPEDRIHLDGVGVRRVARGVAEQKGGFPFSPAEGRGFRFVI